MKSKKKFEEAQKLIKKIPEIRKKLTALGYNKSKLGNLLCDFAECYARDKYSLVLYNKAGYDGVDKDDKRYQIKYTVLNNKGNFYNSFNNLSLKGFDYLIGVFFDEDYNLIASVKIGKKTVKKYFRKTEKNTRFDIASFMFDLDSFTFDARKKTLIKLAKKRLI